MSTLILIAVLLGFNPTSCKAGALDQLFEDNSFTTYSDSQAITCQRIYAEPELGYTLVRTATVWLNSDGSYVVQGYMYFYGQPFPESVSSFYSKGQTAK